MKKRSDRLVFFVAITFSIMAYESKNRPLILAGPGWLHISWSPFTPPRHYIRIIKRQKNHDSKK